MSEPVSQYNDERRIRIGVGDNVAEVSAGLTASLKIQDMEVRQTTASEPSGATIAKPLQKSGYATSEYIVEELPDGTREFYKSPDYKPITSEYIAEQLPDGSLEFYKNPDYKPMPKRGTYAHHDKAAGTLTGA